MLVEGIPCPVCGSVEHPRLAEMSDTAPTEEDVKRAKAAYEAAQQKTQQASGKASIQRGTVTAAEAALCQEGAVLLGDIPQEDLKTAAKEQEAALTTQIAEMTAQIAAVEKKEQRKAGLDKQIPQNQQLPFVADKLYRGRNRTIGQFFFQHSAPTIVSKRIPLLSANF